MIFANFLSIIILFFSEFTSADISCGQNNIDGQGFQSQRSDVSRIIGGRDAKPGEVPWVADLTINVDGRSKALCGGAIIDKYTILTAAHCVFNCPPYPIPSFWGSFVCPSYRVRSFKVCVGSLNKRNPKGQKCFESATFYSHPQYSCCSTSNFKDVAIIKIPQGIDVPIFTSDGYGSTNTICLPPASDAGAEYNGPAIIAGWGRTNPSNNDVAATLQIGQVNLISTQQCQDEFGSSYVDSTQVCAYSDDTSSCNGDSGSALYTQDQNGVATAIGLTSFGKINCQNSPVVYTKVAAYRDFIDQHSGNPKKN